MDRCAATELSTRTDERVLSAIDVETNGNEVGELAYQALLNAESRADTWRIVEAFSRPGLPFALELSWASGSGSGTKARVTVAHASRICVFARSLSLRAANLSAQGNRVAVTVADGFAPCRNQWEVTGTVSEGSPAAIPVPPYAERLRVEVADPLKNPNTLVRLVDGLGVVRSSFRVDEQPSHGVPVGGVQALEVLLNSVSQFRAVFFLSL